VIARVEERINDKIRDYLHAEHRNHRIRAVRIIQALNRSDEFWEDIAELLGDSDHVVRRTAIDALLTVENSRMISFLATATLDGSSSLAHGALEALEALRRSSHLQALRAAAQTAFEELPTTEQRSPSTADVAN